MPERIFIYLRLRVGALILKRSKIREFAGLGSLLGSFLAKLVAQGTEFSGEEVPVLDYVDANSEEVLISFHVDPEQRAQVVEGRIPPPYQARMLNPEESFSLESFMGKASEEMSPQQQRLFRERIARSPHNLLERIRASMDAEGRFQVRLPISRDP